MGTHPIFESDFDCLTDFRQKCQLKNRKPNSFLAQSSLSKLKDMTIWPSSCEKSPSLAYNWSMRKEIYYRLLTKMLSVLVDHRGELFLPSSKSARRVKRRPLSPTNTVKKSRKNCKKSVRSSCRCWINT